MKLNNKGFAISSIMYLVLVLALVLASLILSLLTNRKIIIDKQKNETLKSVQNYPNLSLSKITCTEKPFNDDNWTFSNSTVSSGILTIGANGNPGFVTSTLFAVNGGFFSIVLNAYAENEAYMWRDKQDKCGVGWATYYYDANGNETTTNDGYTYNGWSVNIPKRTWVNDIDWFSYITWYNVNSRQGPNIKYIKVIISTQRYQSTSNWSTSPIQISNLRLCGDKIKNNNYNINVKLNNKSSISQIKYAKGIKNLSYFESAGISSQSNKITVTENGIYTVYVKDSLGNKSVETIEITDIIE